MATNSAQWALEVQDDGALCPQQWLREPAALLGQPGPREAGDFPRVCTGERGSNEELGKTPNLASQCGVMRSGQPAALSVP